MATTDFSDFSTNFLQTSWTALRLVSHGQKAFRRRPLLGSRPSKIPVFLCALPQAYGLPVLFARADAILSASPKLLRDLLLRWKMSHFFSNCCVIDHHSIHIIYHNPNASNTKYTPSRTSAGTVGAQFTSFLLSLSLSCVILLCTAWCHCGWGPSVRGRRASRPAIDVIRIML